MKRFNEIVTAHGGGGSATDDLLEQVILPPLANVYLESLDDSAILDLPANRLCFTTDGYVVKPVIFPGGTIGDLAVCGTVNDLAVMGARPLALSLGLILDEGLPMATLEKVMEAIAASARKAGVKIVTGDTKVMESRGEPGLTITTAGIGALDEKIGWSMKKIQPGDELIVNGNIAEHGLAVMAAREDLSFATSLQSDVAPLNGLLAELAAADLNVRFARDCTRGGLAGVVAEISGKTGYSVVLEESSIPITPTARHAAELLGLDPLNVANEGKVLLAVASGHAEEVLAICRKHEYGKNAARIGSVSKESPPLAELRTRSGGRRIIQKPYGEDLPRIC